MGIPALSSYKTLVQLPIMEIKPLLELQVAKNLHNRQKKEHQEYNNTNMLLANWFLSRLALKHREAYHTLLIVDLNQEFGITF